MLRPSAPAARRAGRCARRAPWPPSRATLSPSPTLPSDTLQANYAPAERRRPDARAGAHAAERHARGHPAGGLASHDRAHSCDDSVRTHRDAIPGARTGPTRPGRRRPTAPRLRISGAGWGNGPGILVARAAGPGPCSAAGDAAALSPDGSRLRTLQIAQHVRRPLEHPDLGVRERPLPRLELEIEVGPARGCRAAAPAAARPPVRGNDPARPRRSWSRARGTSPAPTGSSGPSRSPPARLPQERDHLAGPPRRRAAAPGGRARRWRRAARPARRATISTPWPIGHVRRRRGRARTSAAAAQRARDRRQVQLVPADRSRASRLRRMRARVPAAAGGGRRRRSRSGSRRPAAAIRTTRSAASPSRSARVTAAPAERMAHHAVHRPDGVAHRAERAGELGERGEPTGRAAVRRRVVGHHPEARLCQRHRQRSEPAGAAAPSRAPAPRSARCPTPTPRAFAPAGHAESPARGEERLFAAPRLVPRRRAEDRLRPACRDARARPTHRGEHGAEREHAGRRPAHRERWGRECIDGGSRWGRIELRLQDPEYRGAERAAQRPRRPVIPSASEDLLREFELGQARSLAAPGCTIGEKVTAVTRRVPARR